MSLINTIDKYGRLAPERIAHSYNGSEMSYKQLAEKSDALAAYLIEKSKGDRTPIAVYGHKQHEMLVCFLACVKSGHAYIPIDSSLPAERIKDIIESSETNIVLNVGNGELHFENVLILANNEIQNIITKYNGYVPDAGYSVGSQDVFYIIYTSGSTGKPKGVQITLSCLESFVKWGLKVCNLASEENAVFMNQAPFSFDLSVMDLYLSLASGSTLFSIDKNMIGNLRELFDNFKRSGISHWVSTPSFAEMCLADKSFNKELLPKLRMFLFCGETLSNNCAGRLYERFETAKVINFYGPTEATVAVTDVEITRDICSNISPLPVGRVKEGCRIAIVDKDGKEVSEGQKGEIVIIGDSVSIGYYKNSEMTAKAFFKDFIDGLESRAYRTGDEGYMKNGMLYYSGRIDFQIKLNGFRIELEDIENNLRKVDIIKNSVVFPVINDNKIQYLGAAVVLNQAIEEKEFKIALVIKNDLKKFLPEYMIPRKIVIKEALPMTNNGKVDRRRLLEEIK